MLLSLLIGIGALAAGGGIGYTVRKNLASKAVDSAENHAQKIIEEARIKERDLLLEARDKALKVMDASKREDEVQKQELRRIQERLEKREGMFDQKILEFQEKQNKIQEKETQLETLRGEIMTVKEEQIAKLERIAQLTRDEAKNILMDHSERLYKDTLVDRIKRLEQEGVEEMQAKARYMIADAMQRYAQSVVSETTTSSVALTSDEMKGRIIGKEGRNIKAIENLTGVEILIDETPNMVTVSSFSLIRRHIAKKSIEKLMHDGRIHPGRIEEMVEQSKQELAADIKKAGEEAVFQMGVTGLDPRIVQILGRLKYRTSFGQNALLHSMEVGYLATFLAEELGANVAVCKKGGLLHDIGKAVDHEVQGSHPQLGYEIMKKFKLPEEVAYMSIAHHEDSPRTLEGIIVKVADALSASRPGARKDSAERYVQRVSELEDVATSFDGVDKAYAISAGREIRVFARPEVVDDLAAHKLARDIAKRIEDELEYPGEVKITLIREKRVIEFAR